MDTQTINRCTISEYAAKHGISANTVRRRIKAGTLNAEKVNGKYLIHDTDGTSNQESNHANNQIDQSQLVDQMQSEITHLRNQLGKRDEQIDKLSHLLAMTSAQNGELTKQLPPPRESFLPRLKSLFQRQTA